MGKRLTTASNVIEFLATNNIASTIPTSTVITSEYDKKLNLENEVLLAGLKSVLFQSISNKSTTKKLSSRTSHQSNKEQIKTNIVIPEVTSINNTLFFNVSSYIKKIFSTIFLQILLLSFSNIVRSLKKTIKETKARPINLEFLKLFWLNFIVTLNFYYLNLKSIFRKKFYNEKSNLIQKIRLKNLKRQQNSIIISNNKCWLTAIHFILFLFTLKCALIACDAFSIRDVIRSGGKRTVGLDVGNIFFCLKKSIRFII